MNGKNCIRKMCVPLKSNSNCDLGMTIGATDEEMPTVVAIDSGGPADKNGIIRVGDRVLEINGVPLRKCREEWQTSIFDVGRNAKSLLTIQYDVTNLSNVRSIGRISIEIHEIGGNLGLTLDDSGDTVIITKVKQGSFAERSGAFQAGDLILSVRTRRRRLTGRFSATDFADCIQNESVVIIDIFVPLSSSQNGKTLDFVFPSGVRRNDSRRSPLSDSIGSSVNLPDICVEVQTVTLQLSSSEDCGIVFKQAHSAIGVIVCFIAPNSPAAKSGLLQIGDRILMVNGRVLDDIVKFEDVSSTLHLQVHFDIQIWPAERKTPTVVVLQRNVDHDFGFSVTSYDSEVVIANVRRGSLAHRCGQIHVGDQITHVNGAEVNEKESAEELINSSEHSLHLQVIPVALHSGDSGITSFNTRSLSQSDIIYSSRADSREILDWGMESSSSNSDSLSSLLDQSSTASSMDALHDFLFNLNFPPNKFSGWSREINPRATMAHLKLYYSNRPLFDSRRIPLKRIPISFNSSLCMFAWLEYPDDSQEKEVEVTLQRKNILDPFGFTVFDKNEEIFVRHVKPGSAAFEKLVPHDKIIRVNGTPCRAVRKGRLFVKTVENIGRCLKMTIVRTYPVKKDGLTKLLQRREVATT